MSSKINRKIEAGPSACEDGLSVRSRPPLAYNFASLLVNPHLSISKAMPKAIWNGAVLAQSDRCPVVEGNFYFPPDSIDRTYFQPSNTHTTCSWKGVASYYTIVVDGKTNPDAAWYYPEPKDAAKNIAGYIAFWRGVTVEN
jgi:uncharacterized protein (DUF427 family)